MPKQPPGRASFLDDVQAMGGKQGLNCPVPAALEKVPELAAAIDDALVGSYQWVALERALKKRGLRVAANQLSRHAKGLCRCGSR